MPLNSYRVRVEKGPPLRVVTELLVGKDWRPYAIDEPTKKWRGFKDEAAARAHARQVVESYRAAGNAAQVQK